MTPEITPQLMRQVFDYEWETGRLIWRSRPLEWFSRESEFHRWNRRYAGHYAFRPQPDQEYLCGMVFRKTQRAHRVVWALFYGDWPSNSIDHINGNRQDNRIENLRDVTCKDNARNCKRSRLNTSGITGVAPHSGGRWRAQIRASGRQVHLGVFDTIKDAEIARRAAERALGYHPNHGRRE